jgi:hypothetical protein
MEEKRTMPKGPTSFKPGWKGGPGRPKLPAEVKQTRRLTQIELIQTGSKIWRMTKTELEAFVQDPENPIGELAIAKVILNSSGGNLDALELILNRMVGKVPEKLQIGDEVDGLDDLSEEEIEKGAT